MTSHVTRRQISINIRAGIAVSLALAAACSSPVVVLSRTTHEASAYLGAIPEPTASPTSATNVSASLGAIAEPVPSASTAATPNAPVQPTGSACAAPRAQPNPGTTANACVGAVPEPVSTTKPTASAAAESGKLLKGSVSQDGKKSPFLTGSLQYIPKDTSISITLMGNLNSEVTQKGDEVWVKVGQNVTGSNGVGVPGGWYMHGLVTNSVGQKRLGRNGYMSVDFDSLVSPDGDYVLPFHASISTKDNLMVSAAKEIGIGSGYVSYGALGGAILSVQLTGIGTAIATHGISVGVGAAVGATIGAIGAAKRQGKINALYPGDCLKIVTAEPIDLPTFDPKMLPSAQPHPHLSNMQITINKAFFTRDPMGDRSAHLLTVNFTMNNKTRKEFKLMDFQVVSDLQQSYSPSLYDGLKALNRALKPDSKEDGQITFAVDSNKRKYWLVLLDRAENSELTRVPIN